MSQRPSQAFSSSGGSIPSSSGHDHSWTSRSQTIERIEEIILNILDSLSKDEIPVLVKSTTNPVTGEEKISTINLAHINSRRKFAVVMQILTRAYQLLQHGTTLTLRDLYYEDVTLYVNQKLVQEAVNDIALILKVPVTFLPFESSVKGLMAAGEKTHLAWTDPFGNQIPVVLPRTGNLVPAHAVLNTWGKFESNVKFVLIVEKAAIFELLMQEDIFTNFEPFIMVTGKGYPDKATARLTSKLSEDLGIPTFALVDANPYGLEIASVYKWGSEKQKDFPNGNVNMTVPNLTLLGLLPSDLNKLAIPESSSVPFNPVDNKRLSSLSTRIERRFDQNQQSVEPIWRQEIKVLETSQRKAEIEAISSIGNKFLTNVYLRGRIRDFQSQNSQLF